MPIANKIETYRGVVYPWQMDHMDHMNVQFYTARFDEATWHLFAALGMTTSYFKSNRRGMAALEQRIEASVHVRGKEIFCESADPDMYAAIDGLVDKLDRTIIKHKEKSLDHRHSGPSLKHHAGE